MERSIIVPGFRFHPTDLELVWFYLKRKVLGKSLQLDGISLSEVNIYKYSPWDLLDISCFRTKDLEWYFFCRNERKYASGTRSKRATETGYWESTGKDKPVFYKGQIVGMVKTLVFHIGHVPTWERTDWIMYEYRLQDKELTDAGVVQDSYVLCKVFQKSSAGPKTNDAQYGALFSDKDGDNDDHGDNNDDQDEDDDHYNGGDANDAGSKCQSLSSNNLTPPTLSYNKNDSFGTSIFSLGSMQYGPLYEPGPSNVLPSADEVPPPVLDNEDYIFLLDFFEEDGSLLFDHPVDNEMMENFIDYNSEGLTCLDEDEISNTLGDLLAELEELGDGGLNFFGNETTEYGSIPFDADDNDGFLEVNDLKYPLNCPTGFSGSYISIKLRCNVIWKQGHFPVDSFGDSQEVPAMNQLPLLPKGSNDKHLDDFLEFLQEIGDRVSSNLGSTVTSIEDSPGEEPEVGTEPAVQDKKIGGGSGGSNSSH